MLWMLGRFMPFIDRDVGDCPQFQNLQSVFSDLLQALVAPHRSDTEHIQVFCRQEDRQGVVVPGVAIHDHFLSHRVFLFSLSNEIICTLITHCEDQTMNTDSIKRLKGKPNKTILLLLIFF